MGIYFVDSVKRIGSWELRISMDATYTTVITDFVLQMSLLL